MRRREFIRGDTRNDGAQRRRWQAQPQRKSLLTRTPTMTFRPGASAQTAQRGGRAARCGAPLL
jgi:hypothetical protein